MRNDCLKAPPENKHAGKKFIHAQDDTQTILRFADSIGLLLLLPDPLEEEEPRPRKPELESLIADIRDLGAAVSHVADGKEGAWFELGASIVGFVPGGDIAKGIAKGITKGAAKASAKIGADLAQEVVKVAKASTAKVVDDVAGLRQGAAKARKGSPRGPLKPQVDAATQTRIEFRFPFRPSLGSPHPAKRANECACIASIQDHTHYVRLA